MPDPRPVRPPQVTIAGWLVVAGSVVVVVMAFSSITQVTSLSTRESIESYLSEPPGDALGLTVSSVQTLLRVAAMVAGASAAATAILGWSALQRSRGARVALTALAVPLFLSGLVSGGFVAAVVCAAIVMLWFQPARDWYDGRTPAPREAPREMPRETPPWPTQTTAGSDPLAHLPPPSAPPLYATGPARPAMPSARTASQAGETGTRPPAVRVACLLTWAFASLAVVLLVVMLVVLADDSARLVDEARRQNPDLADQGVTDGVLRATLFGTCGVVIAWSLFALVLAVLAWRRVGWAAVALAVSAGVASAICLVAMVGSLLMAVPLIACASTVALLVRPEVRHWYAAPRVRTRGQ